MESEATTTNTPGIKKNISTTDHQANLGNMFNLSLGSELIWPIMQPTKDITQESYVETVLASIMKKMESKQLKFNDLNTYCGD